MRHHHHDPVDADDHGERADDDSTWALKAAFWLLAVIALGFLLGVYLLNRAS